MEKKSGRKIWSKASVGVVLAAALIAIPLSAVFAESPTAHGAHTTGTQINHSKSVPQRGNGSVYLNIKKLASLRNYTFTVTEIYKGKETKTYGSVYSMGNFELNGPTTVIYTKGQGYEKFKNSFRKISISSPLAYLEKVDEYAWVKQLMTDLHAAKAKIDKVGSCKIANENGIKYNVYSNNKLSQPLSSVCISTKTATLLWYQSYSSNQKNKKVSGSNFIVTSIGKVKPITIQKTSPSKKTRKTTVTVPVVLHSIPVTFPTSIPKPPGNLSSAYVAGNPNSLWIVATNPQSTIDVTKYISSLKSLGYKPYGKKYTNYTTTLKNSTYYITVSYETLGPSVVEMTTSIKQYKN